MSGLNNSLHSKVDVLSLRSGMFVADLDRDWKGTPFPLQGFLIENNVQLILLRRYCKYVYVDPVRSTVAITVAQADRPIEVPLSVVGDGEQDEQKSLAPAVAVEPKIVRIRRGPPPDLSGQADPESFTKALGWATRIRARMHDYLNQAFQDVRLGESVDTEEARLVVSELVDSITENVNAALWLTNLRDKDEYTALHSMSVCVLSITFGRHLGLGDEELKVLGLGALLHDIGKLKTPPEVLNKPGALTPDEYELMKRHPIDGHDLIIDGGHRVPPMALKIIRHHHERLAGTGYPDGLSGENIPLQVLITSVVDVYDAITSDRCYHNALPAYRAMQILYDLAPENFGRELIEEFISCIGIYPVGSLVELTTGEIGVVLSADPRRRLKPLIRLISDPQGIPYEDRQLINLSEKADTEANWRRWGIRRAIDPAPHAIDFKLLMDDEYALCRSRLIH